MRLSLSPRGGAGAVRALPTPSTASPRRFSGVEAHGFFEPWPILAGVALALARFERRVAFRVGAGVRSVLPRAAVSTGATASIPLPERVPAIVKRSGGGGGRRAAAGAPGPRGHLGTLGVSR